MFLQVNYASRFSHVVSRDTKYGGASCAIEPTRFSSAYCIYSSSFIHRI